QPRGHTPTAIIVLGASFSALEVVPLAYIGFEAYERYKQGHATPWMTRYRWPVIVLLGGCLLEHVGAGLLGFLINPPLSLYYMQGSCWVCGSGRDTKPLRSLPCLRSFLMPDKNPDVLEQ